MERAKSVLIFLDNLPAIRELSDAEAGQVLRALLEYAESGTAPVFDNRLLRVVFLKLQNDHDRNEAKYLEKCHKNKEAAKYREWAKGHPGQSIENYRRQSRAYEIANSITSPGEDSLEESTEGPLGESVGDMIRKTAGRLSR